MLDQSLYSYVWRTSRDGPIRICLLIALITPLSMVPLELQRRIVDHAVSSHEIWMLAVLGSLYLLVVLLQGGLKYLLNLTKGRVLEEVTRDLRGRILRRHRARNPAEADPSLPAVDEGTLVSMLAAESEDIGGFASESLAVPLLQLGTILWVVGYLVWVEPLIAALAIAIYAPQVVLVPRVQKVINRLARRRTRLVRKLGREAVGKETTADPDRPDGRTRTGILIRQIFKTRMLIYRHKFFLTFLGNFLASLGPIFVLVAGGYLVIQGQTDLSTLVVFISGFQRLSDPWDQLVSFYRSVSNARVTYALVAEALGGAQAAENRSGTAAGLRPA